MRSNIDLFTLANATFAIECGIALDAEQLRVFAEYSEHVELETFGTYVLATIDNTRPLVEFTGI